MVMTLMGKLDFLNGSIFGIEAVKFHEYTIRSEELRPEVNTGMNVCDDKSKWF